MEPLASKQDVIDRLGRPLTPEEDARITALLADASAVIRAYTGQTFTLVEDDVVVLRAAGGTLTLPQRPVVSVTSVVAVGGSPALPDFTVVDWVWDEIDTIRLGDGSAVINIPEVWWDDDGYPGTYRVTYSHGYATVPDDVVGVACAMVMRVLATPAGVRSESIGPYSVTYAIPAAGEQLGVNLTRYEKQMLARYRKSANTVRVTRG